MAPVVVILIVAVLFGYWLLLFGCVDGPEKPQLSVKQIRSTKSMADLLTYRVSAPVPVDADVVARELLVVVSGLPKPVVVLPASATDLGVVEVEQDAEVIVSLRDVDDAGNYSEPAVLQFVATDTLPPAQPGSLGVVLESERPAPTPEPEVAPEPEVPSDEEV